MIKKQRKLPIKVHNNKKKIHLKAIKVAMTNF